MIKKNQFVLIFLTIVTILAVWYIKTPLDAETNGEPQDDIVSETVSVFNEYRETIRNERSIQTAKYDEVIASSEASIEEKEAALKAKNELSALTEKEVLLELEVISLGYQDAFVHATEYGVEVTVISDDVSASKANEIILMTLGTFEKSHDSVVVNFKTLNDIQKD